jgi:hypothetical protein
MIVINGQVHNVPDVYGSTKVIDQATGTAPAFNGLLIVGNAKQGIPYSAATGDQVFIPFSSVNAAKKIFGNCELTQAFAWAKRGGSQVAYLSTPALLTQTKTVIKDATSPTPLVCFDLTSNLYGAVGNDHQLAITADGTAHTLSFTITPSKASKFLSASVTAAKQIPLIETEGLHVGDTVIFTDNSTSPTYTSATLVSIDTVNNRVTVDTAITVDATKQARMFLQDVLGAVTKKFTAVNTDPTILDQIVGWFNSTGILTASAKDSSGAFYAGSPATIATMSATYLGAHTLKTATGSSTDATTTSGGDWDNFITALPQKMEEFRNVRKSRIRIVNAVTPDAGVHTMLKTGAAQMRANLNSIKVITGCGVTSGVLDELQDVSASTHPWKRALALDTDDITLASISLEGIPAYLSLAPQYAGMMSSNTVHRNLTMDPVDAVSVSKFFGGSNKETETTFWLKSGCLIVSTTQDGFVITQAINTYLKQDKSWNADDNKTYLDQQRQIADYVDERVRTALKSAPGNENTTETSVTNLASNEITLLKGEGYLKDASGITSVFTINGAIKVKPKYFLIDSIDFIGVENEIVIV